MLDEREIWDERLVELEALSRRFFERPMGLCGVAKLVSGKELDDVLRRIFSIFFFLRIFVSRSLIELAFLLEPNFDSSGGSLPLSLSS